MDNGKQNDHTLWRSRLEEPGALPETGLTDKEAAWDKLYLRLQEKPRRRTMPWLWAAAACLLLALIPAAFLMREKKMVPRATTPPMAAEPKILTRSATARTYPAPPHTLPVPAPTNPAPVRDPQSSAPPPSAIAQKTPHRTNNSSDPGPFQPPGQAPDPLALKTRLLELPPMPDLSKPMALAAASQPSPQKQRRVVHINELETSGDSPSMTGARLKPGQLRIGFGQQETFRPATGYQYNDHPILSFKPSQNP